MTAILRVDRSAATNVVSKKDAYSDFMCDLTPHPNTEDLTRVTGDRAVSRAIRNLILTNKGERRFSDIGSNVKLMLFEPISTHTAETIRSLITETINNHEPRARLIEVKVDAFEDNQAYKVSIYFYVINNPEPTGLAVTLYRVR